jgi:hypothetical protein
MNDLVIKDLNDIMQLAQVFTRAKLFKDTVDMNQAAVKILAGVEMGIAPFAAMTGLSIIQGKVAVGANIMAAKIKESGRYDYIVEQNDDKACILKFFENGKEVGTSPFSIEDAKKAGLLAKDIWHKYPRNMLFARAISNGQRWFCPGVLGKSAVYTPEELQELPEVEINPAPNPITTTIYPIAEEATVSKYSQDAKLRIIMRLKEVEGEDITPILERYGRYTFDELTDAEIDDLIATQKQKAVKTTAATQQDDLARSLA